MASEVRTGSIYGVGVYGTDSFGVSNTQITVDGTAGTTAINSVVVTADAPVPTIGVQGTTSLGDIEIDINIVGRPDTDIPMTASLGSINVTAAAPVPVTGVEATNEVGTLPTPDSVYDVTGVQGTTAVNAGYTDKYNGFAVNTTNYNAIYGEGVYSQTRYGYTDPSLFYEVSAVTASGAVGSVTTVSAAGVTPEDARVTGSVGDLTVVAASNFEVSGVSASGAIGTGFAVSDNARPDFSSVVATGSIGFLTIQAGSDVDLNVYVSAEIITDSAGVVGDEVTITADANVTPESASATTTLGNFSLQTTNVFPVSGLEATGNIDDTTITADSNFEVSEVIGTGEVGTTTSTADSNFEVTGVSSTAVVGTGFAVFDNAQPTFPSVSATGAIGSVTLTADSNFELSGAEGTGEVGTTTPTADSNFEVTGVSATSAVDTGFAVFDSAQPTFDGVEAIGSPGNVTVSTTTVIFDVANKNHIRTSFVEPDQPRIVYVQRAA